MSGILVNEEPYVPYKDKRTFLEAYPIMEESDSLGFIAPDSDTIKVNVEFADNGSVIRQEPIYGMVSMKKDTTWGDNTGFYHMNEFNYGMYEGLDDPSYVDMYRGETDLIIGCPGCFSNMRSAPFILANDAPKDDHEVLAGCSTAIRRDSIEDILKYYESWAYSDSYVTRITPSSDCVNLLFGPIFVPQSIFDDMKQHRYHYDWDHLSIGVIQISKTHAEVYRFQDNWVTDAMYDKWGWELPVGQYNYDKLVSTRPVTIYHASFAARDYEMIPPSGPSIARVDPTSIVPVDPTDIGVIPIIAPYYGNAGLNYKSFLARNNYITFTIPEMPSSCSGVHFRITAAKKGTVLCRIDTLNNHNLFALENISFPASGVGSNNIGQNIYAYIDCGVDKDVQIRVDVGVSS